LLDLSSFVYADHNLLQKDVLISNSYNEGSQWTKYETGGILDYRQLIRVNLPISNISYQTKVIKKPFSFFNTYKTIILSSIILFIVLILFVCILMFNIYKVKKMKKSIAQNHEELSQIYEELAASDIELREQYEEITAIQQQLSKSEERYRVATDGSDAIIWDLDMSNMQYQFTDRWYEFLGYEKDEVDETHGGWKLLIHPDDASEADEARNAHLEGKMPLYNTEYRMKMKNGDFKWFNVRGTVLKDSHGKNIRFAGSMIDITTKKEYEKKLLDSYQELEATNEELIAAQDELKNQYDELLISNEKIRTNEEQLAYLAYYDSLTGLPNKESLYEKSCYEFLKPDIKTAILFMDIDHFKYINDTMGHSFGDKLIKKVGERLASLQKENTSVYRLSGDEFIIAMRDIEGQEDAQIYANYIISKFKEELEVLNSVINIGLSIGIAMYPEHGTSIDELLKYSDIAMYLAKNAGRNSCAVYNTQMKKDFNERVNIETHLHSALEKNEFEVYYQPQLDLKTNKIAGFEALLRWNCKELGSIPPDKFIQIAEKTHLIIPLGTWVLQNACAFIKSLHERGYTDLYVSVNISMLQLVQSDFSDLVLKTLEDYKLDANYLELEITETVVMESYTTVAVQLEKLNKHGVKIALDDFGKGYSSLSYLTQLPISTLKIDKSFIDRICTTTDNILLTEYIVDLGKRMGMCVVAEGVETKEQLDYLIVHECNKIQGYFCSRPVPKAKIIELLEK